MLARRPIGECADVPLEKSVDHGCHLVRDSGRGRTRPVVINAAAGGSSPTPPGADMAAALGSRQGTNPRVAQGQFDCASGLRTCPNWSPCSKNSRMNRMRSETVRGSSTAWAWNTWAKHEALSFGPCAAAVGPAAARSSAPAAAEMDTLKVNERMWFPFHDGPAMTGPVPDASAGADFGPDPKRLLRPLDLRR